MTLQHPGGPDISPYASAARAEHLEGLLPTFIGVGSIDLEYARRLMRAFILKRPIAPSPTLVLPGAK